MKKIRRFCLLFIIFAVLAGMWLPAAAEPGDTDSLAVTAGCSTLDALVPLKSGEMLLDTAKAVILYEMNSQTMVYSWNPDEQLDPSGMNKLMTALLAIERGDPNAVVTVSSEALASVEIGAVSAGLKAGEEITLRDLLYCMMVGSANDAAAVIAEHIGGSQGAFVELMNSKALELGCENTCFLNPTGLSREGQYSTARDLAKITEAALEQELFSELFSATEHTVPGTNTSEERRIVTTNYLMSKEQIRNQFDSRVTGGKTGALSTKDRSVICTAESDGLRYLAVVMSAQATLTSNGLSVVTFGSFEETRKLLDHGFGEYSMRQLLTEDKVLAQFSVSGGENDVAVRAGGAVTVMMPNDMAELDVSYQCKVPDGGISAPVREGQSVGSVEVWFRSVCVGQSDLVAMHDVNEPGVYNVSVKPGGKQGAQLPWKTWLLVALIGGLSLVMLCGIILMIVRLVRKAKTTRRHRIRRKNRQRSR